MRLLADIIKKSISSLSILKDRVNRNLKHDVKKQKSKNSVLKDGTKNPAGLIGFLAAKAINSKDVDVAIKQAILNVQLKASLDCSNKKKLLMNKKKYKVYKKRLRVLLKFMYLKQRSLRLERQKKKTTQALWSLYARKKNLKLKQSVKFYGKITTVCENYKQARIGKISKKARGVRKLAERSKFLLEEAEKEKKEGVRFKKKKRVGTANLVKVLDTLYGPKMPVFHKLQDRFKVLKLRVKSLDRFLNTKKNQKIDLETAATKKLIKKAKNGLATVAHQKLLKKKLQNGFKKAKIKKLDKYAVVKLVKKSKKNNKYPKVIKINKKFSNVKVKRKFHINKKNKNIQANEIIKNIFLLYGLKVFIKKTKLVKQSRFKIKLKSKNKLGIYKKWPLKPWRVWALTFLKSKRLKKKNKFFFWSKLSFNLRFNVRLKSQTQRNVRGGLVRRQLLSQTPSVVRSKNFYKDFLWDVLDFKETQRRLRGKSHAYFQRRHFVYVLKKIQKNKKKRFFHKKREKKYMVANTNRSQVLIRKKTRKKKKVKLKKIYRSLNFPKIQGYSGHRRRKWLKLSAKKRKISFHRIKKGFYYRAVSAESLQNTYKKQWSGRSWSFLGRTLWPMWQKFFIPFRGRVPYIQYLNNKITWSQKKKYKNLCSFFFFLSHKLKFNLLKNFFFLKKKYLLKRKQPKVWHRFGTFNLKKMFKNDNKLLQKVFFVRFCIYSLVLTPLVLNKYILRRRQWRQKSVFIAKKYKKILYYNYINFLYNKIKLNKLKYIFYKKKKTEQVKKMKIQKQVKLQTQKYVKNLETIFNNRLETKSVKQKKLKIYINPALVTINYRIYHRQKYRQKRARCLSTLYKKKRRTIPLRGYFRLDGWKMGLMARRNCFSVYFYLMQRLNLIQTFINKYKYHYYAHIDHNQFTSRLKVQGALKKSFYFSKIFKNRFFYKMRRRRCYGRLQPFGRKRLVVQRKPRYNRLFKANPLWRIVEVWPLKEKSRSAELRKIGHMQFMAFYNRLVSIKLHKTLIRYIGLNFIPNIDEHKRLRNFQYDWNKTYTKSAAIIARFKNQWLSRNTMPLYEKINTITAFKNVKNYMDIYYNSYLDRKIKHRHVYDYWSEYLQGFHLTRKGLKNLKKGLISIGLKRIILVMDNVLLNYNYHKTFIKSQKHGRIVYFLRGFFFKEVVNTLNNLMSFLVRIPVKYKIFLHSKIKGLNASFVVTMLRQMSRRAYPLKSMYFHALFLIRRRLGLKGYRLEFSGRFFRRERAIYQVYKKGPLGRRSYDSLLDYKWKSLVMKFGLSTVRVWIHKYDSNTKEIEIYNYRSLLRQHRRLKLKLKVSQKFKRFYSRFVPYIVKKENRFIVKPGRRTGQEVGQVQYMLFRLRKRQPYLQKKRRVLKKRYRLQYHTPSFGGSHKLQSFLQKYIYEQACRFKAKIKYNEVLGEVATYHSEPIMYTAGFLIKTLFFKTNKNIINANIKNLIFTSKRKALLNWIISGALSSVYNNVNFLKKSIEVSLKRGYKYYSNTNRRILFIKKWNSWTTGHFRNNNMLMRLHLFLKRGTKIFLRIQAGFWFKNMYLISKKVLNSHSNKFINNFSTIYPTYIVSRFLQVSILIKNKENAKKKLENIEQDFNVRKSISFYYENFFFNRYSFSMPIRISISKFNNINYSFYETYSEDLFRVHKEAKALFVGELKHKRSLSYYIFSYKKKSEQKRPKAALSLLFLLNLYVKMQEIVIAVKKYKKKSQSCGVTRYLHCVKVRFQRNFVVGTL